MVLLLFYLVFPSIIPLNQQLQIKDKCFYYFECSIGLVILPLICKFEHTQQFNILMEARPEEEPNSQQQSDSKASQNKSRHIKKSPKPNKRPLSAPSLERKQSIFSSLRLTPQFGLFESQMQKQSRLQKFWMTEIDEYYRKQINPKEIQALSDIINQTVPSLKQVLNNSHQAINSLPVPFQQLFRYVEIIRQCRGGKQLLLVENQQKRFLAVFESEGSLSKLIQISQEQSFLISQRHKFMVNLREKQQSYNKKKGTTQKLSEISEQVAFMLHLMRYNKTRIDNSLERILQRIQEEPVCQQKTAEMVRDSYITCLIKKNLLMALQNTEIDYLNYYANLDAIQQYGSIQPEQQKLITDKREFEQYMKRKKCKKARKNMKGILKTACAGCLSAHYQQYNPLLYCPDCHMRFHKYCYTPIKDGLCELCFHKKEPIYSKARPIQCQLCTNRGLLSFPFRSNKQSVSMHIFCMLINGLWKFENGSLQYKSNGSSNQNMHTQLCSICNTAVYTYPCKHCQAKAHPLCAYLSGWNLELGEQGVVLECCQGVDLQKQSYRRKFILNYKKILYKSEKQRL